MGRENRLHPRVVARLAAEARVGDGPWGRALIHDLSVTGAGLLSTAAVDLQAEVHLRFRLPDADRDAAPLQLASLVVRRGPLALPDDGYRHFVGLHFLPLPDEIFEQLRAWVWDNLDHEAP